MDEELEKATLIGIIEEGLVCRIKRLRGLVFVDIVAILFISWLLELLGFTTSDTFLWGGIPAVPYIYILGGIMFAGVGLVLGQEWKLIKYEYAKLAHLKGEIEVSEE